MKKSIVIVILLLAIIFAGCTADNISQVVEPPDDSSVFYGIVLENHEISILVEAEQGSWARNSSDKFSISISNAEVLGGDGSITAEELEVGSKVKISFTGGIAESYPAQIHGCFEVRIMQPEYTIDDFWALLQKEKERPTEGELSAENYFDITPGEVLDEIGGQIFKDSRWCATYLVYDGSLYSLGEWFGGYGVVDIKTCDFDENGAKDLIFTYSWGSGIHRALIGLFDMSTMTGSVIYNSQAENDEIYQSMFDLILEKKADDHFEVYTAEFLEQKDGINFAALNPGKGKLVGKVIFAEGIPEWKTAKNEDD